MIDVCRKDKYEAGKIPSTINIPVDEFRNRFDEIENDKNIFIYCEAGLRGYLAQRIAEQNGFKNVSKLSGGYLLRKSCKAATTLLNQSFADLIPGEKKSEIIPLLPLHAL